MDRSSSKLAPAQKAFSPSDLSRMAFTAASFPVCRIVWASFSRISPGRELLFGCPKVISAILFLISWFTNPLFIILYLAQLNIYHCIAVSLCSYTAVCTGDVPEPSVGQKNGSHCSVFQ